MVEAKDGGVGGGKNLLLGGGEMRWCGVGGGAQVMVVPWGSAEQRVTSIPAASHGPSTDFLFPTAVTFM